MALTTAKIEQIIDNIAAARVSNRDLMGKMADLITDRTLWTVLGAYFFNPVEAAKLHKIIIHNDKINSRFSEELCELAVSSKQD